LSTFSQEVVVSTEAFQLSGKKLSQLLKVIEHGSMINCFLCKSFHPFHLTSSTNSAP